jgi:hypothetical protein
MSNHAQNLAHIAARKLALGNTGRKQKLSLLPWIGPEVIDQNLGALCRYIDNAVLPAFAGKHLYQIGA